MKISKDHPKLETYSIELDEAMMDATYHVKSEVLPPSRLGTGGGTCRITSPAETYKYFENRFAELAQHFYDRRHSFQNGEMENKRALPTNILGLGKLMGDNGKPT